MTWDDIKATIAKVQYASPRFFLNNWALLMRKYPMYRVSAEKKVGRVIWLTEEYIERAELLEGEGSCDDVSEDGEDVDVFEVTEVLKSEGRGGKFDSDLVGVHYYDMKLIWIG